jgi:hypothetical protein
LRYLKSLNSNMPLILEAKISNDRSATEPAPWHLVLRHANVSRISGSWQDEDYDVFDGDREVGRVYRLDDRPDSAWFWGVSFQLTGRKSYGHTASLDDAKAAFRAQIA